MKRRSGGLDQLWEDIKYGHEIKGRPVPMHWRIFWRLVHTVFDWKAARS